MGAELYLWDDQFVWMGSLATDNVSNRYAVTMMMSLDGKPMDVTLATGDVISSRALLVLPRIKATLHASLRPFMSVNWDPHSREFHALSQVLSEHGGKMHLPDALVQQYAPVFTEILNTPSSCGYLAGQIKALFQAICPDYYNFPQADARVLCVANRLREELPSGVNADALATELGLSAGRLSHLFTAQLGISMRNFLLWAKARRAIGELTSGRRLTDIALGAGFADSAHFTRTLQQHYSVTPSFLANDAEVSLHRC
ncbi:helix-turn-helix domain-containing protein [Marinobacter sp. SS21]|uniref:helix-turn-helix domain-containing protein n=1 Tax=Marinobacter sp. SS21 TaxID=2979460 RepID=UPI00232EBBD8|nr:AraC family transcriptional regulator [Marinobacter sp. SS21]MDC0663568.1 AraC family transcriptional regulator [Marinobacter sp. SS21]